MRTPTQPGFCPRRSSSRLEARGGPLKAHRAASGSGPAERSMVPPSLPSVLHHPTVAVKGLVSLAGLRGVDLRKGGHSSRLRVGRTLGAPWDEPYWPLSRKVTQTHPASQSTAHDFFVGPLLSRGSEVRIPPGAPPLGGPLVAEPRTQRWLPVLITCGRSKKARRRDRSGTARTSPLGSSTEVARHPSPVASARWCH